MKRILFFALLSVLFHSCTNDQSKPATTSEYKNYITGLASPIRLKFDSTTVFLGDYFTDVNGIEKIEFSGQEIHADGTGKIVIKQKPATVISNLKVQYKNQVHDIPVFSTEKVSHHFTYKPSSDQVTVVEMSGSMNGWNRKATTLRKEGDVFATDLILNNGLYQYRIWEDGKEMMDANNPDQIANGMGAFNNTFYAGQKIEVGPTIHTREARDGVVEINASSGVSQVSVYFENKQIEAIQKENHTYLINIPAESSKLKRSHIRVFASDGIQRANDLLIPLSYGKVINESSQLDRTDMRNSVMYFMMVDRFVNGNTGNDRPTADPAIHPKANNLGGDLQGITQKIKDGYFENLGINTIWVSPVCQNAEGAWGLWNKGVESKFSGYHGYWPIALKQIDNRFGDEASLKELIDVAHQHNMNVIIDYVAHHVHQDHPLYKQKPEWTTPLYLPDGTMNTEKWDEHRLTTWFDTFLPTWKFADHEVVEALTDTAMYWVEHYDLDGFRHDATKHIEEDFWRTLTHKVKKYGEAHPERVLYQVGETYGSPELISSYINSGELDAQFDFNLYDASVDAFGKDESDFKNLDRVLQESMHYYGSHHLMGNITGNQDRARFISYADGSIQFSEDAKLIGWTKDIQNKGAEGFEKLAALNAFLMTTPGIPCIYYGDEIGMPGGNDPDNRRMMHFGDWNADQQNLFERTQKLVQLRRNNLALTYGDLFVLKNDEEAFIYVRSYFGKNVIVVMTKNHNTEWTFQIPKEYMNSSWQSLGGTGITLTNDQITSIPVKGRKISFEVFY